MEMKRIRWLIFCVLLACFLLPFAYGLHLSGSRQRLCDDLRVRDKDLCHAGANLNELLHISFELGETTQEEVHSVLEDRFLEMHERRVGGVAEVYLLENLLYGEIIGYFSYNEDGVLTSITIED